jgi:predicted NBD/HSP70 family sugar kinase
MDKYSRSVIYHLYSHSEQTRSQINSALKMRLNSLVEVCDCLENDGLVVPSEPGRKRNVLLNLNPAKFGMIGIDHQVERVRLLMLNGLGEKVCVDESPLPCEKGQERLRRLMELTADFRDKHRNIEVTGIGMADVGLIDREHGIGVFSAHVEDWRDLPLEERFRKEFQVHFSLVNRIDAGCFADLSGRSDEDRLQVWCGDGIGMSVLHKGEFAGRSIPYAGELGHTIMERGGKLCRCGNRGCLETVAGASAITAKAAKLTGLPEITLPEIIARAADGSRICETVLREAGETVGVALANAVVLIGIFRIGAQGPLPDQAPAFREGLEQELSKNLFSPLNRNIKLEFSRQRPDDTALGAALFARHDYFEDLKNNITGDL